MVSNTLTTDWQVLCQIFKFLISDLDSHVAKYSFQVFYVNISLIRKRQDCEAHLMIPEKLFLRVFFLTHIPSENLRKAMYLTLLQSAHVLIYKLCIKI